MQLLVPPEISSLLSDALKQAGKREIGGILMGEHVGSDVFRIRKVTIQRKGGTFASFVRMVADILAPLHAFFDVTRHEYTKYNYLGEWHSHHSFALMPSPRDHKTMQLMVIDPELGAHFVVLLLVKLSKRQLNGSVTVYRPNMAPIAGEVIHERFAHHESDFN